MSEQPDRARSSRYRDIATGLQREIRLGTYAVGNLLPTETELMASYQASRQTVREALRILIDQGLIVRRAGLGSVVIASSRRCCSPTASNRSANGCAIPARTCPMWSAATSLPTASSPRSEMRARQNGS